MPKNHHLIHAIYNEPWLISVNNHLGYINAALQGVMNSDYAMEPSDPEPTHLSGSVAIIPIRGTLIKDQGVCGEPGMVDYGNMIREQISDPTIDAIVLKIDSPGGMVRGTDSLSSIIQSSTKPIVAFVDDEACSGAYWIAAACSGGIVANNDIARLGSIGVVAVYQDVRKANEEAGITEHIIFAKQSTQKWRAELDVLDGKYDAVQSRLSVVADRFITHVQANRPNVLEDQLTGEVFFAKDVVGSLIDEIGDIEVAVSRARSQVKTNQKNNTKMSKPKFSATAAAVGVEDFETKDDYVSLSVEQLGAVETALHSAQSSATQAATALDAANATIASLTQTVSDRDARITALENGPGAAPAAVAPAFDGNATAAVVDPYEVSAAAAREATAYDKFV